MFYVNLPELGNKVNNLYSHVDSHVTVLFCEQTVYVYIVLVFIITSLMHCIIMFIFSIKSYYVNLIIKYLQIYAQRWNHQVH